MRQTFSNRCTKENTTVSLDAGGVHFAAKGSVMLVPGWQSVFNQPDEPNDEDDATMLPALSEGDTLPVHNAEALVPTNKGLVVYLAVKDKRQDG